MKFLNLSTFAIIFILQISVQLKDTKHNQKLLNHIFLGMIEN